MQKFPGFWIPQAKISRNLEFFFPYMERNKSTRKLPTRSEASRTELHKLLTVPIGMLDLAASRAKAVIKIGVQYSKFQGLMYMIRVFLICCFARISAP